MSVETSVPRRLPLWLLAGLCLLPAAQTGVAVWLAWHPEITYPAMKLAMIAAPLLVWWYERRPRGELFADIGCTRTRLLPGTVLGLLMAGVILGAYYGVLRARIDPAPVAAKIRELGVAGHYWLAAIALSLGNSAFEEYYWRAFLVGQWRQRIRRPVVVIVLGGVLFGLHHIFAMASAFGGPLVVLGVGGTMLAGAAWTWLRVRGGSIWDCWLSHILADLAIVWVGYDLLRRAGG